MANKALEDKFFNVPITILESLAKLLKKYDGPKDGPGYMRARHIVETKRLPYTEMKRLKNFFDKFEGATGEFEYLLNGGDAMKSWVYSSLGVRRKIVDHGKKLLKDLGWGNTYKKTHDKDRSKNASKSRLPRVGTSARNIYNDEPVYESLSLKRIFDEFIKGKNL